MKKKPPDEFPFAELHGPATTVVGIILVVEYNRVILNIKNSMIANSNSVSVSAQILNQMVRFAKRFLAKNNPFFVIKFTQVLGEPIVAGKAKTW